MAILCFIVPMNSDLFSHYLQLTAEYLRCSPVISCHREYCACVHLPVQVWAYVYMYVAKGGISPMKGTCVFSYGQNSMSDTTASIIELMANGCPLTYRGLNPRFLFSSNFRSELHYQAWWCLSLRGENDILPLLQFLSYGQGLVFSKLLSVPWFPFL